MKSPFARAISPLSAPDEDPSVGRILRAFFGPSPPRTRPAEVVALADARRTDRPR